MLTPEQIDALRDSTYQVTDPIVEFLLKDIARRIKAAGQFTSTAQYQIWIAQQMGLSQKSVEAKLRKLLNVSKDEIKSLLTQTAEVGYNFDLDKLDTSAAIPFHENGQLQQIIDAAVKLAEEDFINITQTIGMVDPHGIVSPLRDVYRKCTDYAFKQVFTGATDYNTAVRGACKNLAQYGIQTIDYQSGVHTSLEAAIRRNIMGGIGLMQEQISQLNHDQLGADGWEISAHEASAPDHEPIQGKQYPDADYIELNNSLLRRIGTLNCGHSAFPIILGVNRPQYTADQLEAMRDRNEAGIDYKGRHYTTYEATQLQRKLERQIRFCKRKATLAKGTNDTETLEAANAKRITLQQEYERFTKAAGLVEQRERLFTVK